VIEAETYCHLVTLNKINIHNTSCVLTCESLFLTCISVMAIDQMVVISGVLLHGTETQKTII